ncbi:MAG: hypothetical protein IJ574_05995 [Bacilli bacterium]|nr:hypothetical protein [Bacilli bacterium]
MKAKYKVVATILLISIIFRFCFVITHLKHDCSHDDNCPICEIIHRLKNDIDLITPNINNIIIAIILLFPPIALYCKYWLSDKNESTLVGLKVKLLN